MLDLGCGTGTWALEAASHWKAHGTRITGFDLVDIARDEWGRARDATATQNLRFVRGNLFVSLSSYPFYFHAQATQTLLTHVSVYTA